MLLWIVIGAWLASLVVITCRVSLAPRRLAAPMAAPRYTLIRICGGPEPHLVHNLMSVLHAKGVAPTQVLVVIPHADPQRPLAEAACHLLRERGCAATYVPTQVTGANHKVAQLAATFSHWPAFDDVVCADGDVDLTHYPLDALRAALQDPNVAAAWAPCAEAPDNRAHPAAAAVLSSSLHCFALLGRLDRGGMVGKLWAVRGATVERAGGWASLVDTLGEDMELARRFRALGMQVVMAHAHAWSRPTPRTWRAAVARYARWFWVIRAQRPHLLWTYPLCFFGTSCIITLCAYQAIRWPWQAASVALLAVLVRLALAAIAKHALQVPRKHILRDAALSEITLWAAFVCMLMQRTVRWRHQRLHVRRGGRITMASPC